MLEILEEEFALGGDIELLINAAAMVLNRSDRDVHPPCNARRRVAAEDQSHELTLAAAELGPQRGWEFPLGETCRASAGSGGFGSAHEPRTARPDIEFMECREHRKPRLEPPNLGFAELAGA